MSQTVESTDVIDETPPVLLSTEKLKSLVDWYCQQSLLLSKRLELAELQEKIADATKKETFHYSQIAQIRSQYIPKTSSEQTDEIVKDTHLETQAE